jgi:signal transduction histidine kinase/ActR/RegA family two-component response regulator
MPDWNLFDPVEDLSPEEVRPRLHAIQAILARAPVPIAVAHDPGCRFISANRALAAMLQVPPDANISLTPPPGHTPLYRIQRNGRDIPPDELPMQYAIAHRTSVSNEIEMLRSDGIVIYVQNDVEPLYDAHGAIYGCVSVLVDLTHRKLAERVLREADRRKDEFLATLSHELRNPLAPIRNAIELMRIAHDDPIVVEKARATTERQLLQLVRITDDLLDVARIAQNKIDLRTDRIDLRSVIHGAVEATRPMIDAQGHTLVLDLPQQPLWADADPTRLGQAFSNLLNNAAKYTERGGRIQVRAAPSDSMAEIIIADTGIGIATEMLPRIFDLFAQVRDYRDRTQGGLGIGLTLARRLIELHGGSIEAASDGPGLGSRFVVRLNLAPVQAPTLAPRTRDDVPTPLARVLIAEDNADTAEMLRLMLAFKGHDVKVAIDGLQAVEIAGTFKPHVAFIDIGMPRMDGHDAARRIRDRLGQRVMLVALTGWGQDEDKRRSIESGFDRHLTKPPEPEVLDRLIAERLAQFPDDRSST